MLLVICWVGGGFQGQEPVRVPEIAMPYWFMPEMREPARVTVSDRGGPGEGVDSARGVESLPFSAERSGGECAVRGRLLRERRWASARCLGGRWFQRCRVPEVGYPY